MKRIKLILNAAAIAIAIAGAFATHYYMKDNQPQYIPAINGFKPAGDFGIDYKCYDSKNVCTFYQPDSVARPKEYLPYRNGQYIPVKNETVVK